MQRTRLRARYVSSLGCAALAVSALMIGAGQASARGGSAPHPRPGAVYAGRPVGFSASDDMHWRVSKDGRAMRLVGAFYWSYGCQVTGNYGIADAPTLKKDAAAPAAIGAAPAIFIHGSSFFGSEELVSGATGFTKRDGRFKISGQFTGRGTTATVTFSFSDPPVCKTVLTKSFRLRG